MEYQLGRNSFFINQQIYLKFIQQFTHGLEPWNLSFFGTFIFFKDAPWLFIIFLVG